MDGLGDGHGAAERREPDAAWRRDYGRLTEPAELTNDELRHLLDVSAPWVGDGRPEHDYTCRVVGRLLYERLADESDSRAEDRRTCLELWLAGASQLDVPAALLRPTILLAVELRDGGRHDAALALLDEVRQELGDESPHHALFLRWKARVGMDAWRYGDALRWLDEADEHVRQRGGSATETATVAVTRSAVYLHMGVVDRAATTIRDATETLERALEDGEPVAATLRDAYTNTTSILMAQGHCARLIDVVDELVRERAELLSDSPTLPKLLFNAALACEILAYVDDGRREEARRRYGDVLATDRLDTSERVRSELGLARFDLVEGRFAEVAERLAALRTGELDVERRAELEVVEARLAIARGAGDEALLDREGALQDALSALVERVATEPLRTGGFGPLEFRSRREPHGALVDTRLALGGANAHERALQVVLDAQCLATLARAVEAPPITLQDLRESELVGPERGLLVCFSVDERTHLFAIDGEVVQYAAAAGLHELRRLVEPFVALVRRSPSGLDAEGRDGRRRELTERSEAVRRALLPDAIADRIAQWRSLTITGREQLFDLPLECLPLRAGGRALGLELGVGHVPSLPWAVHVERSARPTPEVRHDLRLVCGVLPGADDSAPPVDLALTESERQTLTRPFDATRVDVLAGREATLANLRDRERGPTRVLHLLTHGVFDPERELSRGLLLSPPAPSAQSSSGGEPVGGALFGRDVAEVAWLEAAPLVLLSACASSRGPERRGDGEAATLVGQFLLHGAVGVLATPADAELGPTVQLMGALGEHLAGGDAPVEALRRARVALAESGFDDPYHYGLVRAVGRVHRPLFAPAPRRWNSPWALGAAAVVVALFVLRRRVTSPPAAKRPSS